MSRVITPPISRRFERFITQITRFFIESKVVQEQEVQNSLSEQEKEMGLWFLRHLGGVARPCVPPQGLKFPQMQRKVFINQFVQKWNRKGKKSEA